MLVKTKNAAGSASSNQHPKSNIRRREVRKSKVTLVMDAQSERFGVCFPHGSKFSGLSCRFHAVHISLTRRHLKPDRSRRNGNNFIASYSIAPLVQRAQFAGRPENR